MKSIIYVPGIAHGFFKEDSIEVYAHRYLKAIDSTDSNPEKKYSLSSWKMAYGSKDEYVSDVATIVEIGNDGGKTEVCKIYQLEYSDLLTKFTDKKNIIIKLLFVVYFLTSNISTFIKTIISDKTKNYISQNIQYIYIIFIFIIVFAGGILMIPSLILIANENIKKILEILNGESIGANLMAEKNTWAVIFGDILEVISKFFLSLIGFVAIFFPKFQDFVTEFSNRLIGMGNYLRLGNEKLNIIGKLEVLVEAILETDKNERLEVHGYSLGSIIVLDAFFPYGNEPSPRLKENVDTIVTIGCLYDFIAKFFPKYFKDRKNNCSNELKWFNIYSRLDIVSSNFSIDRYSKEASHGIVETGLKPTNIPFEILNPGSLSVMDYLFLVGLKAHTMYWGSESESISCLKDLVLLQKREQTL
jgi:hypothetical protein